MVNVIEEAFYVQINDEIVIHRIAAGLLYGLVTVSFGTIPERTVMK
jgi:hypothetical protein